MSICVYTLSFNDDEPVFFQWWKCRTTTSPGLHRNVMLNWCNDQQYNRPVFSRRSFWVWKISYVCLHAAFLLNKNLFIRPCQSTTIQIPIMGCKLISRRHYTNELSLLFGRLWWSHFPSPHACIWNSFCCAYGYRGNCSVKRYEWALYRFWYNLHRNTIIHVWIFLTCLIVRWLSVRESHRKEPVAQNTRRNLPFWLEVAIFRVPSKMH